MDFIEKITTWIDSTALHQQIHNIDVEGLFSNPWFIVPFLVFVLYSLWKKNLVGLVFAALALGVWYLCGTDLMSGLINDGELNTGKILPIVGIGLGVTVVISVLLFGRSD